MTTNADFVQLGDALANVAEQAHTLKSIATLRDWLQGCEQRKGKDYQDARDAWARFVRRWKAAGGVLEGRECDCGKCMVREGRLTGRLLDLPPYTA